MGAVVLLDNTGSCDSPLTQLQRVADMQGLDDLRLRFIGDVASAADEAALVGEGDRRDARP